MHLLYMAMPRYAFVCIPAIVHDANFKIIMLLFFSCYDF